MKDSGIDIAEFPPRDWMEKYNEIRESVASGYPNEAPESKRISCAENIEGIRIKLEG